MVNQHGSRRQGNEETKVEVPRATTVRLGNHEVISTAAATKIRPAVPAAT